MKQVNRVPTSGQFVAVWEYGVNVWSSTYQWEDGKLQEYNDDDDDFRTVVGGVNRTAWGYDPNILETTKFYVGGN